MTQMNHTWPMGDPATPEAREAGCTCSASENMQGPECGVWCVAEHCPVHAGAPTTVAADQRPTVRPTGRNPEVRDGRRHSSIRDVAPAQTREDSGRRTG